MARPAWRPKLVYSPQPKAISYFCPNVAYFGGDIDATLIRPEIVASTCRSVFQYIAKLAKLSCAVSDKGFYLADFVEKLGGLAAAGTLVRNSVMFAVLLDYVNAEKGTSPTGVFLSPDRRRYLTMERFVTLFKSPEAAASFVDLLIGARILRRGIVLKCGFCRSADWFGPRQFGDYFVCKRCARKQSVRVKNFLGKPEPPWHYQLDEVTFQGLRNNMQVPLLALDYLRKNDPDFAYADELELRRSGETKPFIEMDICCIYKGELTIGEAKATQRIDGGGKSERRSLHKYRDAALLLGARRFIIATTSVLSATTLSNAHAVFLNSGISVLAIEESMIFEPTK